MHEVVLMAVRKAVSAATRTFTANSMIRCFFIRFFVFFSVVRWCGGQPLSRLEARDYSAAESSALRVSISPPKLGGVRGGLNKRYNYRGLLHWPFFRPPRPSGSPPNSGGEEVTLSAENSAHRTSALSLFSYLRTLAPPRPRKPIRCRQGYRRRELTRAAERCRRSPRRPRPSQGSWR